MINKLPEKWCVNGISDILSPNNKILKNYFKKLTNTNWTISTENYFYYIKNSVTIRDYNFPEGYTLLSIEEFKKYVLNQENNMGKEFELPLKWYVKATKENEKILRDWRKGDYTSWHNNLVMFSDKMWGSLGSLSYNYVEITFEQFKKYVLKENNMKEKEIIGYKLIKPEYREAARLIHPYGQYLSSDKLISTYGDPYLPVNDDTTNAMRKAGVLDIWFEPVYKSSEVTIKIGDIPGGTSCRMFNLIVKGGKVWQNSQDITDYVIGVHAWYMASKALQTTKIANFDFIVKDIILSKTGCQHIESSINQWLAVYDELKKQQLK